MNTPATQPVDVGRSTRLVLRDLGRLPYARAFDLQKRFQRDVIESRDEASTRRIMYLLMVEHDPPVITVSRRANARQHLVAGEAQLAAAGVEVAETDRGGDITYHGPGQLVVYPILDLNTLHLRLHGYMRFLEQIVIDTLAEFGIRAHRDPDATGVWVGGSDGATERRSDEGVGGRHEGTEARRHEAEDRLAATVRERGRGSDEGIGGQKICAMGVRISRWVSMHGLALNVTTNLDHFDLIVPCGLAGRSVTSMHQLLGEKCPTMDTVKSTIARHFHRAIDHATL